MSEHESHRAAGGGVAGANGSNGGTTARRGAADPLRQVRAADIEPYTGLGYLSKLFRLIAVFLVLLLALEVGTGLYREGSAALPTLLSEASRLVVLAGLLWGVGDLANLLIDVGHDVRAARILLGRQVAHSSGERPAERASERATERPADQPTEWDRERTVERAVHRGGTVEPRPGLAAERPDPELHP